MERSLLTRVLRHTGGNQVQAAKLLGITRGSLRTKIRTLGIQIGRSVWSAGDQPGLLGDQVAPRLHRLDRVLSDLGTPPSDRMIRRNSF